MKIKPLGDRILVEKDEPKNKYEGLLVLPKGTEEEQDTGTVVGVGPGVTDPRLSVGARVVISEYYGHALQYEGRDFLIVREGAVLGVCRE